MVDPRARGSINPLLVIIGLDTRRAAPLSEPVPRVPESPPLLSLQERCCGWVEGVRTATALGFFTVAMGLAVVERILRVAIVVAFWPAIAIFAPIDPERVTGNGPGPAGLVAAGGTLAVFLFIDAILVVIGFRSLRAGRSEPNRDDRLRRRRVLGERGRRSDLRHIPPMAGVYVLHKSGALRGVHVRERRLGGAGGIRRILDRRTTARPSHPNMGHSRVRSRRRKRGRRLGDRAYIPCAHSPPFPANGNPVRVRDGRDLRRRPRRSLHRTVADHVSTDS